MSDIDLPEGIVVTGNQTSGPILQIETPTCHARLSLRGGQVLAWQPTTNEPVLWLSDGALFEPDKAIRGGIPVCWPWFADHPNEPNKPLHGFARVRDWELSSATVRDGEAHLHLKMPLELQDSKLWPHASRPTLEVITGQALRITLAIDNTDPQPITISQALHSYFAVSDIAQVCITGLEGRYYYDKLTNTGHHLQDGAISFEGEVDRIYRHGDGELLLRDPGLNRTIAVRQAGGESIIIWNPWIDKTRRLGDMGNEDAYRRMVCIETGSVADQALTLAPGQSHRLQTDISVIPRQA